MAKKQAKVNDLSEIKTLLTGDAPVEETPLITVVDVQQENKELQQLEALLAMANESLQLATKYGIESKISECRKEISEIETKIDLLDRNTWSNRAEKIEAGFSSKVEKFLSDKAEFERLTQLASLAEQDYQTEISVLKAEIADNERKQAITLQTIDSEFASENSKQIAQIELNALREKHGLLSAKIGILKTVGLIDIPTIEINAPKTNKKSTTGEKSQDLLNRASDTIRKYQTAGLPAPTEAVMCKILGTNHGSFNAIWKKIAELPSFKGYVILKK